MTTAHLIQKEKSNILVKNEVPTMKEVQQVLAAGENTDIDVGDWVVIDMSRFVKQVQVRGRVQAGIGGGNTLKEELIIPFFAVPGDPTPYLKISDREIEGVIPVWNKLPNDVKAFQTMEDFKEAQEEAEKEGIEKAAKAKAKIDIAKAKKNLPIEGLPIIRTDSQKL